LKGTGEAATAAQVEKDSGAVAEPDREVLEHFIEEEEGALNRVGGWVGRFITAVAVAVSLFHLYAAFDIVPAHILRPVHVACVLFLVFLLFPMTPSMRDRIRWWIGYSRSPALW